MSQYKFGIGALVLVNNGDWELPEWRGVVVNRRPGDGVYYRVRDEKGFTYDVSEESLSDDTGLERLQAK